MLVNAGLDAMAGLLGGDVAGFTGTATASSATSLTATGTPFVASAYTGHIVVATTSSLMYGVVTANTTSVLTVDQWYGIASPGGAAVGPPPGPARTRFFRATRRTGTWHWTRSSPHLRTPTPR